MHQQYSNTFMLFIIFYFISSLTLFAQENESAKKAALIVKVQNIANDKGSIRLHLYDSKEDYLKNSCKSIVKPAKAGETEVVFENLPMKAYALVGYHDENENDEVDTYFSSLPKERYGFSNHARSLFGPPAYESSKFKLDKHQMVVSINLE